MYEIETDRNIPDELTTKYVCENGNVTTYYTIREDGSARAMLFLNKRRKPEVFGTLKNDMAVTNMINYYIQKRRDAIEKKKLVSAMF